MKFECLNCQTAYSVASSKIPQNGAWVKCKKCGLKIHISPKEKKPDKNNAHLKQQLDELNQSPHNRNSMLQIEDFEGEAEKPLPKQNLSEKIIKCPKCGKQQKKSLECNQCGIIFAKVKVIDENEIANQVKKKSNQTTTKNHENENQLKESCIPYEETLEYKKKVDELKRLEKPMKALTFCFATSIVSMLLLFIFIDASDDGLSFIFLAVMLITSLFFYINLGILTKRMGRSWIVWVGLTFITKPIGPIVSFFWIRSLIKQYSG